MPARVSTGGKHGPAMLALLAEGPRETADFTAALRLTRACALRSLRGLERAGRIVEAFRRPRRDGKGRRAIVWRLAT